MNRFAAILADINDRLDIPQPCKYRIMQEIAADLEDAFEQFRADGMHDEEAELLAVERIAADDHVIEQLIEIHETPFRRWLRSLSFTFRHRIELGLWIVLLVTILGIAGISISGAEMLAGSPFAWIIGGLMAVIVSITAARWYTFAVASDHRVGSLWRGLHLLIFLSGLTGTFGLFGFTSELGHAANIYALTSLSSSLPPVSLFTRSLMVMIMGAACAVAGAVMWFILVNRALTIEDQETAFRAWRRFPEE